MNSGSSALQNEAAIVDLIPALRAFARTFCRDKTDADDLVQETLLKGIAHIDQFEPGTRIKSWLFTIMRNTFYTKHKIYTREAPGANDCASARSITYGDQEWHLRSQEVHAAIGKLPPRQREVLMLIAILGVSYEETASICGCAIGTIKSRLNRARMSLLEDLGGDVFSVRCGLLRQYPVTWSNPVTWSIAKSALERHGVSLDRHGGPALCGA
ncbi:sigma-70 family RNA polymerase sigma factor [Mesorhizobium sp. WSM4935]|uniref:sigma-70 family RNA polymerase sigma factor n=1 Tax=Mesorhizobium sp. WSM4935 TaxID=3038547 RepID=UPI002414D1C1|nr:sigma-70 family RNA polymerase sigma factor [Mesorhizobium sp. WSM4935]MDG4874995.1 sigma-70 family RNA polymerase sigma factor [Mesorhizobium sp. WSM4935]